jgi:hypothetical protein
MNVRDRVMRRDVVIADKIYLQDESLTSRLRDVELCRGAVALLSIFAMQFAGRRKRWRRYFATVQV